MASVSERLEPTFERKTANSLKADRVKNRVTFNPNKAPPEETLRVLFSFGVRGHYASTSASVVDYEKSLFRLVRRARRERKPREKNGRAKSQCVGVWGVALDQ